MSKHLIWGSKKLFRTILEKPDLFENIDFYFYRKYFNMKLNISLYSAIKFFLRNMNISIYLLELYFKYKWQWKFMQFSYRSKSSNKRLLLFLDYVCHDFMGSKHWVTPFYLYIHVQSLAINKNERHVKFVKPHILDVASSFLREILIVMHVYLLWHWIQWS